jgi:hypothetical protein
MHSCIHPSIHASIHPSMHPSKHPSIHISIHSSVYTAYFSDRVQKGIKVEPLARNLVDQVREKQGASTSKRV